MEYKVNYLFPSGKGKLTGKLFNNSTLTQYKDAQVKIEYYSYTKTLLKTEYHTIYNYFPATKTTPFALKFYGPKGTNKIRATLTNASY